MSTKHTNYTTPDGEKFCEKSQLQDPEGKLWNVTIIENFPPDSKHIFVTNMGQGNPNRRINLLELSGWTVSEYDTVCE